MNPEWKAPVAIIGVLTLMIAAAALTRDYFDVTDAPQPTAPTSSPAPAPAPTSTSRVPVPRNLARIELDLAGTSGATVYFGRLGMIVESLSGQVDFATDPDYLRRHPDVCAETVVVSGVPGTSGVVYAMNLGTGWGAAENPPPQALTEPTRTIHQQIIVPPGSARPGADFTGRVRVTSDTLDATTTGCTLSLDSQEVSVQSWTVGTGEVVTCVAP